MAPEDSTSSVDQINPNVLATVCFVAIDAMHALGLGNRLTKVGVINELKVVRSYIYERQPWLERHLAALDWSAPPEPALDRDVQEELQRLRVQAPMLRYRAEHPGAWGSGDHNTYGPALHQFVLQHASDVGVGVTITQAQFAEYVEIPLPTLKDWWSAARGSGQTPGQISSPEPASPAPPLAPTPIAATSSDERPAPPPAIPLAASADQPQAQGGPPTLAELTLSLEMLEIIKRYDKWEGTVRAFVGHLRNDHNLRYSRKEVTEILHIAAERKLLRRAPPTFRARGSSFTPPPGVQATSDGKELVVVINGRRLKITWQPTMDVGSTLIVGNAIRPNEDAQGVLASFGEGVANTGVRPDFFLLDNKECNKSAELVAGMPVETTLMYSSLGRPQNKAVIEGMFGLFDEELGEVVAVIDTTSEATILAGVAEAVTRAWDAGRNGRRRKRDGLSPIERYRLGHTAEERKAAIDRLSAIKRRHDERNACTLGQCNPEVVAALHDACTRFGFDKDGDILASLGTFSIAAVREAAAIYHARKQAGRLDPDAGLRYFGGIVRNCQYNIELILFEHDLVDQLRRSGKLVLDHLERTATSFAGLDLAVRLTRIVDELLNPVPLAQVFWRQHLQTVCAEVPLALRPALRQHLCRRIRNQMKATVDHRQQLISLLVHALTRATQIPPEPAGTASPSA